MNWIESLAKTYDENASQPQVGDAKLIPPFHTAQNAHIIVTLNEKGDFLDANYVLDKKSREKIIPCTEDSSSRTSGPSPHPLFDKLEYLVGTWPNGIKVGKDERKHPPYIKQLREWCTFDTKCLPIHAVLNYLEKDTLIDNLCEKEILPVDFLGNLVIEKPKGVTLEGSYKIFSLVTGGVPSAFVLFKVVIPNSLDSDLWENKEVRDSWISYSLSQMKDEPKGFCQILGREAIICSKHPKRIRNPADGAKLISGNDSVNFTYRGRFETSEEACAISVEVTQKAHSALRWLIAKQGRRFDTQYIVAWAVSRFVEVPQILDDTQTMFADFDTETDSSQETQIVDLGTAEVVANALNKLISGYAAKTQNDDDIIVMTLDAATPGTMSIKLFRELKGSEFFDRVKKWHTDCAWLQRYSKDKIFYGAPAPNDIARAAYGTKCDDVLLKRTADRILPCILDAQEIPSDIVNAVMHRVANPNGLEHWEFVKYLSILCALFNYNLKRKKQRSYSMTLEKDRTSRDYLYGRLLAVADYLEFSALAQTEKDRPTNAMRMMSYFSEHPYSSWLNLHKALMPYLTRLQSNSRGVVVIIEKLLGEIHAAFDPKDFENDKPLTAEFLLGYYCQKNDLFTKKDNSTSSQISTSQQGE